MFTIFFTVINSASSFCSYLVCTNLIKNTKQQFICAGLKGKDYGKKDEVYIPEAMGIICALTYLIFITINLCLCYLFSYGLQEANDFSAKNFCAILAGLSSICSMALLGFADDVLNLKWRVKLIIPLFASFPVLLAFHLQKGSTFIHVPFPFKYLYGSQFDLGLLFYLYILLLSIFCTNSINILAGINGLEVGQSIIIALSMCLCAFIEIMLGNKDAYFILFFLLPFIGVSYSILELNWYPATVFVGDSYCYFTGMTFAVAGILSNKSFTLLLLFIPQILNFLYSTPQLFKLLPCPRHRLPKYDEMSDLRSPSTFEVHVSNLSLTACVITGILARFGFATIHRQGSSITHVAEIDNLTLINGFLRLFGSIKEDQLCTRLLIFQFKCSIFSLFLVYVLGYMLM